MKHRAYSTLEIKSVEGEGNGRTFKGIASTPSPDREGDIVEPKGAEFKLPIPLLWQHDSRQPIGWVTSATVTDKGIEISGEVADIEEEGELKTRLLTAWQSLKSGLVRGLSIGFRPVESSRIEGTYSYRYTKWSWLELSAVTIPANADASITSIKAADTQALAALGHVRKGVVRLDAGPSGNPPPGDSGNKKQPASGGFFYARTKGNTVNIQEQIKRLVDLRTQKAVELSAIQEKAATEGRTKDASEREAFVSLTAEIKQIDEELDDLREIEKLNVQKAVPVAGDNPAAAAVSRGAIATGGAPAIHVKTDAEEKFKGQNYTRMVIAKALARMDDFQGESPITIAERRWGKTNPTLVNIMKAAVAGGGSGAGEWGSELVQANNQYTGDFIEYLYSQTVYDKLPLRQVPANVQIKGQDGAATGYWVGESKAIPASAADFSAVNLAPLKVGALAVVSNELLRDSSPSAEMLVRDALVQASAQRVDTTFLSATAASAGVSPAGILNGLTPIPSAGNDGAGLLADIKALYAPFIAAKNATGLHLVTTPSLAKAIQLMRNALGQTEFPGITAAGGTLEGDPVVTGDNVGSGHFILLKPSDIYRIGDYGVQVSISREAMIEQDGVPTGATDTPVAASAYFTSMFQSESTAIKVVRPINFAKRRASAVAYVDDADYGSPATPSS
jgi:HK97 family phage major capsid protein/HK97 family phage prohead protease